MDPIPPLRGGDPLTGELTDSVEIYVARQPIYDSRTELFGYELLYRNSAAATVAAGLSTDHMSSTVVMHSLVDLGLPQIIGSKRGFINFSRDMLVNGFWELFDRNQVVIELLETVEPDEDVLRACGRLRQAGYTLALDDFENSDEHEPLLRLANLVKLDVLGRSAEELEQMVQPLTSYDLTFLAERVESADVHQICRGLGFEYFQGYYFSRPEIVVGKEMPTEQVTILRLISLVRDLETSESALEQAFRADVGLTFKLLRIVNSAAVGGRGVESIRHAIQLLGRGVLARWLGLLMIASLGKGAAANRELSEIALARARICERIAEITDLGNASGALFMVGLFSMLDRLMSKPMAEILGEVDLAPEVKDALVKRCGPYAGPLLMLEAYEVADWDEAEERAEQLGLPRGQLARMYVDALAWGRERLTAVDF